MVRHAVRHAVPHASLVQWHSSNLGLWHSSNAVLYGTAAVPHGDHNRCGVQHLCYHIVTTVGVLYNTCISCLVHHLCGTAVVVLYGTTAVVLYGTTVVVLRHDCGAT